MLRQGDAMIRFFLKTDPRSLTEWEWAERVNEIKFCLHLQKTMLWGDGDKSS